MGKYTFNNAERYTVFAIHGEQCYLCKQPLDFKSMHVDHVIPESLLDDLERLDAVIQAFGLSKDYSINSFENWMPACVPCNMRKLANVFEPTPLIQLELQNASRKADEARSFANEITTKRKVTRALLTVMSAIEEDNFTDDILEKIEPLIELHRRKRTQIQPSKPIRLTPVFEVTSEEHGIKTIKGPYGIGARPAGDHVHGSFNCPNCGTVGAWNGARCVVCGQMDED